MTDTSTVPRNSEGSSAGRRPLVYDELTDRLLGMAHNRTSGKKVLTDVGSVDLAVPPDRNGTFEPRSVRKGQTRVEWFNEAIVSRGSGQSITVFSKRPATLAASPALTA